jgi:hypothetical protein
MNLNSRFTSLGMHHLTTVALMLNIGVASLYAQQRPVSIISAAAQTQLPIKGTFQGQDAHDTLPPGATTVLIHTTATGSASHMGRFSLIREITGNLTNFTAVGSAQWIAANGDIIYTTIAGQAELSDLPGGFLKVTEIHTITGGTGRFTGAQGSFTVELFHKLEPSAVTGGIEAHDIFGSFHGTITSPGAAH